MMNRATRLAPGAQQILRWDGVALIGVTLLMLLGGRHVDAQPAQATPVAAKDDDPERDAATSDDPPPSATPSSVTASNDGGPIATEPPDVDADPTNTDEAPGADTRQPAVQPSGTLPWDDAGPTGPGLPPRKLIHPSELLELYGIAESQLKMLADGEGLGPEDEETLIRILYQMPRFPLASLQRWAVPDWDVAALVAAPADHRSDALRLAGRATHLRHVMLPPELAERFEFSDYYLVTIESDQPPCRLEVCTRAIPRQWQPGPMDEPVSALGLFLKPSSGAGDVPTLVCVTPRVAWHPDRVDEANFVAADHLVLAELGMDIGLFDAVRLRNRKGIEDADSECFYQLLAAAGRAAPGKLTQVAERDPPFGPLLQSPRINQGRIFSLAGTARRVSKILVGEKDLQERFGLDHYYQVDIFVPLGNQVVRLGDPTATGEVPTFEHDYPITVCVRELPPGMREGDDIRQQVRVAAIYFKLWSYRSEYISSFDDRQLQIGPLLIGQSLQVIDVASAGSPWVGVIAGFLFLVVLAITWLGLWRTGRNDRKFEKEAHRRRDQLVGDQSLEKIEPSDGPDFSNLG